MFKINCEDLIARLIVNTSKCIILYTEEFFFFYIFGLSPSSSLVNHYVFKINAEEGQRKDFK